MKYETGGTVTSEGFVHYARHPTGYFMPVRLDFSDKKKTVKPPVKKEANNGRFISKFYVFVAINGEDYLVPESKVTIDRMWRE